MPEQVAEKSEPVYFGTLHASQQIGCDPSTLKAYEKRGIVRPARTTSGRRLFTSEDIAAAIRYRRGRRG